MSHRAARRRLVLLALGGATVVAVGALPEFGRARMQDTAQDEHAFALRIQNALDPTRRLEAFGRAYLRGLHERPSIGELVRLLLRHHSVSETEHWSDAQLAEMLRAGIDHDFAAGRLVNVAGWLLCRYEALLCALVARLETLRR